MEKILSVSVASYNVESTLCEALIPFTLGKEREKLDIMIVDDGSKDRPASIAQEFVKKYPDVFRLI